jgi:hypothetical protein
MDKKTAHEHGHIALELMELIFWKLKKWYLKFQKKIKKI